jgi:uncharacterized membrane-anchored protein YhcB (DUF1043 family)
MSIKEKLEEKIQKTERKLNEVAISLKRLDREYQQLLEELALTPEQLSGYVENPDNFSPPIWEYLQNEKKKLDEKLNLELSHVSDPLKTKKTFSERGNIQPHWLFVR